MSICVRPYGAPVAFLFGWNEFFFTKPGVIGALCVAFVAVMTPAGQVAALGLQLLCVLGLLTLIAALNVRGVAWAGRLQVTTTSITVVGLVMLVLVPFVIRLCTDGPGVARNLTSTSLPGQTGEDAPVLARLVLVLLAVMWAYAGWHGATPVAEEVRDPQKTFPGPCCGGWEF